jgi:hypothetical protein
MWTFKITTGEMTDPEGNLAGKGYAGGDCGKRKDAIDNPADEGIPDVGPIPEGTYRFGDLVVKGSRLGPYCFPLHLVRLSPNAPAGSERRGGFWCHADTAIPGNASEGCIVMPYETRVRMYVSIDHTLEVVR